MTRYFLILAALFACSTASASTVPFAPLPDYADEPTGYYAPELPSDILAIEIAAFPEDDVVENAAGTLIGYWGPTEPFDAVVWAPAGPRAEFIWPAAPQTPIALIPPPKVSVVTPEPALGLAAALLMAILLVGRVAYVRNNPEPLGRNGKMRKLLTQPNEPSVRVRMWRARSRSERGRGVESDEERARRG
jgi:hypothetical protein